jgi:hypothetical protein
VRRFVRQRRIEALGIAECLNDRHLDIVAVVAVEGAVATIADVGLGAAKNASAWAIRSTGVVGTSGLP